MAPQHMRTPPRGTGRVSCVMGGRGPPSCLHSDAGVGPREPGPSPSPTVSPLFQRLGPVSAGHARRVGLRGGLAGVRHHGHQQPVGPDPAAQHGASAERGHA